jgi:hypothetical protein
MTGEIRERYGRDEKHLSHSLSSLYKGISKDYGRDKAQTGQRVSDSSKRLDFAIPM